jgi:hypothetical protein
MTHAERKKRNKAAMLKALEDSLGIVKIAAKKAGIDKATHHNYYNEDPEYAKAVDAIRNDTLDFVEACLYKKIEEGDTTAIIFYLKCKGKERGYLEKAEERALQVNIVREGDHNHLKKAS